MGCTEATAKTSVYRQRNPHSSPLYQCVRKHYEGLARSGVVHRRVEEQVLDRFIDCGDLHKGFARIYCDDCGHDYLLAFSCKTRYFCPSCHRKRMLAYGDWVEEKVLRIGRYTQPTIGCNNTDRLTGDCHNHDQFVHGFRIPLFFERNRNANFFQNIWIHRPYRDLCMYHLPSGA